MLQICDYLEKNKEKINKIKQNKTKLCRSPTEHEKSQERNQQKHKNGFSSSTANCKLRIVNWIIVLFQ